MEQSQNKRKDKHTSLIEEFFYPKFGPGQFWNCVKDHIKSNGGELILNEKVEEILRSDAHWIVKTNTNIYEADICVNTMPLKNLFRCFHFDIPQELTNISEKLEYRDFLTVGLELSDFHMSNDTSFVRGHQFLPDNWLYIQDEGVKVGRVQIFNNWSPYMVKDIKTPWVGLEYFCQKNDDFWSLSDQEISQLAFKELIDMNLIDPETRILNSVVVRAPKAYPKYSGSYCDIDKVKNFILNLDGFYSIGRNGMHRYNNQDHSMLSAMKAVDHIIGEENDKESSWKVNTSSEYIEEK